MTMVEVQYDECLVLERDFGRHQFGLMSNQVWHEDPKRLLFVLSRYKFVSKMLQGKTSVLEVGCADAFGTRIVRQVVPNVMATDIDPLFINDCRGRQKPSDPLTIQYQVHDVLSEPLPQTYEAIYSLDVFEHIPRHSEKLFIANIKKMLPENGVLIVGCPSLESQTYASKASIEGHVNCKSGDDLAALFREEFHNVFLFSMNDEVVHTGFNKMAHYLFVVCTGLKQSTL